MDRDHDDLRPGHLPLGAPQGVEPPHAGHPEVHQHDFRAKLLNEADGFLAVSGLAEDAVSALFPQQVPDVGPHAWIVVHDQYGLRVVRGRFTHPSHPGRRGRVVGAFEGATPSSFLYMRLNCTFRQSGIFLARAGRIHLTSDLDRPASLGIVTSSSVPPPGLEVMVMVPPIRATRSRIPISPMPFPPSVAADTSNPRPSSVTAHVITSVSRRTPIFTDEACACFDTLFSASCTMRYSTFSTRPGSRGPGMGSTLIGSALRADTPSARNSRAGPSPRSSRIVGRSSCESRLSSSSMLSSKPLTESRRGATWGTSRPSPSSARCTVARSCPASSCSSREMRRVCSSSTSFNPRSAVFASCTPR